MTRTRKIKESYKYTCLQYSRCKVYVNAFTHPFNEVPLKPTILVCLNKSLLQTLQNSVFFDKMGEKNILK